MPELNHKTIANLRYVRDAIAGLQDGQFKMTVWGSTDEMRETQHTCGSAGCIGGWTQALLFDKNHEYVNDYEVGAVLGLNEEESDNLFFLINPENGTLDSYEDFTMFDIKQQHAVKMLDHILAGGKVDWNLIMLPQPVRKDYW